MKLIDRLPPAPPEVVRRWPTVCRDPLAILAQDQDRFLAALPDRDRRTITAVIWTVRTDRPLLLDRKEKLFSTLPSSRETVLQVFGWR